MVLRPACIRRYGRGVDYRIDIAEASPQDADDMAEIHLSARREAMPYLHLAHTEQQTRAWFARLVGDRPSGWWVARCEGRIVGYMLIVGQDLDHLYVRPGWQRRGIGGRYSGRRWC